MGIPKRDHKTAAEQNAYQDGIRDKYLMMSGFRTCSSLTEAHDLLQINRERHKGPLTQEVLAAIEWFQDEVARLKEDLS